MIRVYFHFVYRRHIPSMLYKKSIHRIIHYATLSALTLVVYILLDVPFLRELVEGTRWESYIPVARKISLVLLLIFVIIMTGQILEKMIHDHDHSEGDRYNLIRVTRLTASTMCVVVVIMAFLFHQVTGVLASVGIASLVLGFALQAPIASFIAWLYIIFRKPYVVGDRIQFKGMKGDVVEIHYLDTTIEECSGVYLGNDHKSGRLIHFPNSTVLTAEVVNYSGQLVPFIWNETPLQVSYTSDLDFVESCLLKATEADFREQYPDLDAEQWAPNVYFRSNAYAWMEAVISYPVEPFDTTGRRNRILRRVMPLLNAQPEQVQFPEGVRR